MSKSEGQVLDFEKICRLCLLEKRSMSAIFSKKKGDKKVPLPVRIMSCASLELYEGDGLPASICNKCLLSVNQSFAFREQCEQADTTLRQYAQRMNEANEEPSTNREPGERIANISLEPIADVGIKNKEGSGDGRGVGGGVEEKEVVEQDEKCHRGKNANKLFGLGMSSFVSEQSSSSKTKVRGECLGNNMGLSKNSRKKGSSSTKAKSLGFNKRKSNENGGVGVGEKLNVLLIDKKMKRVSKRDLNEFEVKEEEGRSVSPALRTCFKEEAENVIVVADIETISANFLSGMEGEDDDDFKKSMLVSTDYGNPCGKESAVKNNSKEKSNSVNDIHLQLQKLIKSKEIVVQKRPPKILMVKKESDSAVRQKENLQDFKMKLEEVDTRPSLTEKKGIPEGSNECQIAKKLVPKPRNKPEIILEEFSDEECKNVEGGKQKWKHGKDTVFCKDCKIFLLRSSYCNHIKFVHKKVRKYLCQSCGYAACTGTILRQHVQAVHGGYSFYCDQCPRTFNLMKRLRKHMEVEHLGKPVERNHVCQYCGMAFTKPAYLKRHLRSHTQETPYQCRYCSRRFKYHWPKVQHERLHTGEKPYKCSFCDERFTQNCVRKLHEYKKHGNEEFKPKTRTEKVVVKRIRVTVNRKKQQSEDSRGSYHSGSEYFVERRYNQSGMHSVAR